MTDKNVAGSNNSDLTEMNRSAIVRILQQKMCSRADIARMTGLTQASVTKITAVLIEMGIVSEVGIIKGNGNRRSIGLRLNAEDRLVIGVKFSRHMFTIGVFDISGKLYTVRQTDFEVTKDTGEVIAKIKKQIHGLLKKYTNVVAIGMAVPGPFFREKGRIAVITAMPGWHDVDFVSEFSDEFDKPVFIEQDANAGAMAEWWFGKHNRPVTTLAYLLAGEGIGSGVVDNGNLLLGMKGVASEIGHMSIDVNGPKCECGNFGCLELYCSAPQMIRLAKRKIPKLLGDRYNNRSEECNAVFDAARGGNKKAEAVVDEIGRYLGYGCINILNAYNPDIIVIGDILSKGGDLLLPVIMETIKERVVPEIYDNAEIEMSELGIDSTLLGAAAIATDKVLRRPSEYLAIV
ncbi:MAG: ROK family transcriptional regulator [Lachnospiraceae bacterium]|nr:ROK family transcriptional regulator [Lachnospiraceae bacterium]